MKSTISNGRFTGDFMRPGAGKTKFQGAVLPKQNRGAGFRRAGYLPSRLRLAAASGLPAVAARL